ncbi:MAG: nucleotidyl transferase AbiEii/AbiGii toxin family protein [Planctomycetales bacterium]
MIPLAHIQQWTTHAPWPDLRQVEQDLIICRAICDLFNHAQLRDKIAFRGGTAINKLLFEKPLRYSEDIDLVQTQPEPIGSIIDGVRDALSWLGKCNRDQAPHTTHLVFKFTPEMGGGPLKLKIEINTREHQNFHGLKAYSFEVESDWHPAKSDVISFEPEELFSTKLRALLQRDKHRDLFDLNEGLLRLGLDCDKIITCLGHYLADEGHPISRANAEERMLKKLNRSLTEDISPLLPAGVNFDDDAALVAFGSVWRELITRIPGESWKLSKPVIEAIRKAKFPSLLDGVFE